MKRMAPIFRPKVQTSVFGCVSKYGGIRRKIRGFSRFPLKAAQKKDARKRTHTLIWVQANARLSRKQGGNETREVCRPHPFDSVVETTLDQQPKQNVYLAVLLGNPLFSWFERETQRQITTAGVQDTNPSPFEEERKGQPLTHRGSWQPGPWPKLSSFLGAKGRPAAHSKHGTWGETGHPFSFVGKEYEEPPIQKKEENGINPVGDLSPKWASPTQFSTTMR